MKIAALDLGDQWTGIALSDALGILARPYKTVATRDLVKNIENLIAQERIATLVVGLPKTMKGTSSQQTIKTEVQKKELEQQFPQISWILWDERLTSKQASLLKKNTSKEERLRSHSLAASLILQNYLDYLAFHKIQHQNH